MGEEFSILDETVDDLEAFLDDFDGDLEALLRAEKDSKNRQTAIAAIKDEIERREDNAEDDAFASVKDNIHEQLDTDEDASDSADAFNDKMLHVVNKKGRQFVRTGVTGFDDLFDHGIPKNAPVLLSGGSGSGKTIFGLQTLAHHAREGEKCFYMSFEESEDALKQHMRDFGWDPEPLIEQGNLRIEKFSPFDITRKVEAALAKEKGELMIDIDPVILPDDFDPDFIVVDSLTAIASAFTSEESSYRIYLDQLFEFFRDIGANSFLITETDQEPEKFSPTGVEEFLADGVIVLYNFRRGDSRDSGIEVLKMRGESHEKKIAAMQITDDGITVYPDQQVFGAMD